MISLAPCGTRRFALLSIASLALACTLDASKKNGCASDGDCQGGFVCEQAICRKPFSGQPGSGGTSGSLGGGAGSTGKGGGAGSLEGVAGQGGRGDGGGGGGGNGVTAIGGGSGGAAATSTAGAGGTAASGGTAAGGTGEGGGGVGGGSGGEWDASAEGGGGPAGLGEGGGSGKAGAGGSGVAGAGGSGVAGAGGSGTAGGAGGSAGSGQSRTCATSVAACPAPVAGQCTEKFCGGRLWRDARDGLSELIQYRIVDPAGAFTTSYRNAIKTSADAWSNATSGLIRFQECSSCVGRFVSIVPGDGDGVADPASWEQIVPLPVDASSPANIPLHRIAHQWGHVLGLGHTYERADRDRYVRFDPSLWCGAQSPGLPPRCAYGPDEVGSPRIASDTFGAFDEKSKMNALQADGVCGTTEPDPMSGEPTAGDAAALEELFFSETSGWAPFQPLGRSISPTEPLDFQLAPSVDPVGAPAIATWTAPGLEIFARGSDGGVYGIHNQISSTVFQGWSTWQPVGSGVDADPAAGFADADTLHLVVRLDDKSIRLRTRTGGSWGAWASLGSPPGGAASAPALAVRDSGWLAVIARGADGLVYGFNCTDPATMCAASAARPEAWEVFPSASGGKFVGKPSADWSTDGVWLLVTAVTDDARAWVIGGQDGSFGGSTWVPVAMDLDPNDLQATVSIQSVGSGTSYFARNSRHALINSDGSFLYPPLGGVLASPPSAVIAQHGVSRIDVAALIEDHGRPGVWWKFFSGDGGYTPPCNYNLPGTCAQCGCNVPNSPSCFQ